MIEPRIKVLTDANGLANEAAGEFVAMAGRAIARNGVFSVALSGGSTPKALYSLLAEEPRRSEVEWASVDIFFGDERCVPPDHAESNYRMAKEAMLDKLPFDPRRIHRMRGEIEPEAAATEYGQLLKARFGEGGGLDLTLLGMGDDGHTASLFPGTEALGEQKHRCLANRVEKLNAWRLTLTAPFINRSGDVMILVGGESKRARLQEVLEGPRDPNRLPIQLIQPEWGGLTWLIDAGAAGMASDGE